MICCLYVTIRMNSEWSSVNAETVICWDDGSVEFPCTYGPLWFAFSLYLVATPLLRANETINQEGLAYESASSLIRVFFSVLQQY